MPRRCRLRASDRPAMPPPMMAMPPSLSACALLIVCDSGMPALRRDVHERRCPGPHRLERTLERRQEVAGLIHLLAVAAASLDHLFVVGRGLELGERHDIGLGGSAVGINVERRLAYRVPGM